MRECRDMVHLLSDYVNEELNSLLTKRVENHLARCPRCTVVVNTLRRTILLCQKLEPVRMPPEVHRKLHVLIKQKWSSKRTSFKAHASKKVEMKRKEVTGMKTKRYHPLAEFARMDDAMDRFFGRFFPDFLPRRRRTEWFPDMGWTPMVDLVDRKNHFILRADLPGLKKEEIKISVSEDNLLTITGETKRSAEDKREDYYRCERCYGAFSRTVQLPADVIPEKVEASLNEGILEVKLPKRTTKKAKELEIEVK
jgi:HSP20 family protein